MKRFGPIGGLRNRTFGARSVVEIRDLAKAGAGLKVYFLAARFFGLSFSARICPRWCSAFLMSKAALASFAYDDFHLLMPLYICRRWKGLVAAREHQALKWVAPKELRAYPMPPADAPLIPALIDLLG